ncbi:unnamed protein product [Linum tenue]|uniref:Pectinesterase n=1 Tax=Linum tenue TaxID=586396 RepID=A0AAV0NMQ5_9ROSI|nr:unnamed protein product [Linum tenue]
MSSKDRHVFESFGGGGRKLLQAPIGGISVSQMVVVDKEGEQAELDDVGDGIGRTTITGNRSVVDGSTTFNSSTLAVVAPGFVAVGMTFRNTAGPSKMQAVAVRNGADMSAFFNCSFEGYQDTLYVHSLRQFYRDCTIYGTIDYIFGNRRRCFPELPAHVLGSLCPTNSTP